MMSNHEASSKPSSLPNSVHELLEQLKNVDSIDDFASKLVKEYDKYWSS